MEKIISYKLSSGESILFEVDESRFQGGQPVGLGANFANAKNELVNQFASLTNFIKEVRKNIADEIADASDISMEFGVKIGADVGFIVAKSQVEANFKVSVSWKK